MTTLHDKRTIVCAGYFDKAIQQSGSATDEWAFNYNPRKAAFELGESLGIHTTNSKDLMDGLRLVNSRVIVNAAMQNMKVHIFIFNYKYNTIRRSKYQLHRITI